MKTIWKNRLSSLVMGALLWTAGTTVAQTIDPWAALQTDYPDATSARFVPRLRQRNFTPEQARQTLDGLAEAQRQGLPVSALSLRMEEGLAKNIEPALLLTALQDRLHVMTQARDLLQASHYDVSTDSPCGELLLATGLAIESGVPAEALSTVLQRGNGQSSLRIQSIVEAGESLHLAGMDPETTQALMNDCLDRDLRRMEVLRAVRYSIQQHRGGMNGDHIRRSLWGETSPTGKARGWQGGKGNGSPANAGNASGMGIGSSGVNASPSSGGGVGQPSSPGSGNANGGRP